jgi:ribonuclease E
MPESQMIINYVPGEECRVAVVEDGKLEEYYVEKFASASRVGNIYVGRVANVEPAIQAAFVDFGVGDNGFLHSSDLHPRYFPGQDDDTTERVGLKTPRRERPPIQACLRKGDEVMVQVLKEGVGTKGPTLTSYLSIPGRFLVMMPYMEKSGVSRKVEDEDQRRQMREILDQLELPEGFGFIVRTAGMERTKMELKRDLAYLQRLWKDMEKRLNTGKQPRLLYSESDLLVRCLRDVLTSEMNEVIIDNELALQRAARFMKIVAPRGQAKLLHYPGKAPIFHTFGVEPQVALIHAREVPLPSGGRLVIDQTEALVAIDVNSGKSRDSRNSEDNAYQTNIEAVDEICRQLRLRDMGGIVINDLIDMRHISHRKDIENRFKERLKRDRARSTVLPISEFGILQLTRQRMRASHESVHFVDCPTCRGRGMVQRPESIASDALRDLAAVLDVPFVAKVEMVVAPRVAGELLSSKRQLLSRIERHHGKHVDVRVSEAVPLDRVSFYAYDNNGADIDITNLPRPKKPKDMVEWKLAPAKDENWAMDVDAEIAATQAAEPPEEEPQPEEVHPIELEPDDLMLGEDEGSVPPHDQQGDRREGGRRRRRRGRGRGRDRGEGFAPGDGRPAPGVHGVPPNPPRSPQPPYRATGQPQPQPWSNAPATPSGGPGTTNGPGEGPLPGVGTGLGQIGDEGGGRRRRRRRGPGRGGDGFEGSPQPGGQPMSSPQVGMMKNEAPPEDGRDRVPPPSMPSAPARRPLPRRERVPLSGPVPPAMLAGTHGDSFDPPFELPDMPEPQPISSTFVAEPPSGSARPELSVRAGEPVAAVDDAAMDSGEDLPDGVGSDESFSGDGQGLGEQPQPGEGGEGQGGRRRRRRRRGRGGRGRDGAPGQPQGGMPSQVDPVSKVTSIPMERRPEQPRRDDRGPDRGPDRGSDRRMDRPPAREQVRPVQREPERASPPPPPPATPAAAASAPTSANKPRLLYANIKRKVSPAELNRRAKPE